MPIKLSITITVVIEKAITITIIRLRLRLQLLVYHGNDSRLFIRHVHLCMIERATVLRCENVNNQTFILHPGLMKMKNDEDEFIWLHMQNTIAAIIQR